MGGSQSSEEDGLSAEDLEELMSNTQFSNKELEQWYEKFHEDYPDGFITKEQFVIMYSKMFPDGDAKRFASHVFRAYDTDGNGTIDFKEFMTTLSTTTRGSREEKLDWAFRMYDINGDGHISRREAMDMLYSIYKSRGLKDARHQAEEAALQIFISIDKDHNDKLTREEFVKGASKSSTLASIL